MPTSIWRDEVQRLIGEEAAVLVEVLPTQEYEDEHIEGAINIPLKGLNQETTSHLDKARPLIVYWHDAAWDMSPRAAWRLETRGFTNVYDYVGGKADWFSAGLPREGKLTSIPRAGDVARPDLTCRPTDRISDVLERVHAADKDTCIVTTDGGVVLGRVRTDRLDEDSQGPVEEVMELGPTTTRADTMLESILERLNARNVERILVATSDGQLVGTLYRSDAERRLHEGQGEEAEQPIDEESCCCCRDWSVLELFQEVAYPMNRRSNPKRLAKARSGFTRRRLFWSVAASLALVTAAFSLFASGLLTSSGWEPTVRYEIAPDIALATAAGNFQLSDQRGKVVVLYFSFPGWPTCALEAPALGLVQREFGDQGVEVVAINQASQFSLDDWQTLWRSTGALNVTWAQDTNLQATRTYGVTALGTTIIIDRDGQIVYRDHKPTSQETLQSELKNVL